MDCGEIFFFNFMFSIPKKLFIINDFKKHTKCYYVKGVIFTNLDTIDGIVDVNIRPGITQDGLAPDV